MKYLYVVDYWVPFPSSEYGGVINVIAENDVECHDLLLGVGYDDTYDNLIMSVVNRAPRFGLVNDEESRIVGEFLT
jgi:hypothetical protein